MSKFTSLLHKFFDKKTLKFFAVGVINTVLGAGIMFISYNVLKINYWISSAMNYVVVCIVSFFLNNFWTFGYKDKSIKTVLKFILTVSVCYALAYGAAEPLIKLMLSGSSKAVQENVAMACGMVLYTIINYLGQRFFAFAKLRTRRKKNEEEQGSEENETLEIAEQKIEPSAEAELLQNAEEQD